MEIEAQQEYLELKKQLTEAKFFLNQALTYLSNEPKSLGNEIRAFLKEKQQKSKQGAKEAEKTNDNVTLFCFAHNEGAWLPNRADCWEECLLIEFERHKNHKDKSFRKILSKEITTLSKEMKKLNCHPQDALAKIFLKNVTIDFEAAKSLHLYDVIGTGYFKAKNEIGKAILQLASCTSLSFFVYMREFESTDSINLDLSIINSEITNSPSDLHSLKKAIFVE